MIILISLGSFLLGLFALRRIYLLQRAAGSSLFPLTFICFLTQHIAFGLAPLLMAIFDQGYTYLNLQGIFPYSEGIIPLELVNLVSMYAALIGVWIATIGRHNAHRQQRLLTSRSYPGESTFDISLVQKPGFRLICYITLAFHAVVFGLQRVDLPSVLAYPIVVLTPIVVATFYFWGLGWQRTGRDRWVFIAYAAVFGLISLSSGGRGYFLAGILVFSVGYLVAHNWRVSRRGVVLVALGVVLLLWLITVSENIRLTYASRNPANLQEWLDRGSALLSGTGAGGQQAQSIDYAIFRDRKSVV
jgi:hypothetical protein